MRDLFNKIKVSRLFDSKVTGADDTPIVSAIIDLAGYESAVFVLEPGTLTDANAVFSVKVEDGDDSGLSDAAAVTASKYLQIDPAMLATPGTGYQAAFDFSNDNARFKIGYLGHKRYVRITVTSGVGSVGANTGDNYLAGSAILSNARHQPAGVTQTP